MTAPTRNDIATMMATIKANRLAGEQKLPEAFGVRANIEFMKDKMYRAADAAKKAHTIAVDDAAELREMLAAKRKEDGCRW